MALEGDFRKLAPARQAELRCVAVAMVTAGKTRVQAAAAVGVNRRFVGKWVKAVTHSGDAVLAGRRRGRRPDEQRALTFDQESRLRDLITDHRPHQLQLPFARWTRKAAQSLIERETGVLLALPVVGRYLRRWGFTTQSLARPFLAYMPSGSDEILADAEIIELMWRLAPEPRRAEQALHNIDEIGRKLEPVASAMRTLIERGGIQGKAVNIYWSAGLSLMGIGDALRKRDDKFDGAVRWYRKGETKIFSPLLQNIKQSLEVLREKASFERVVNLNRFSLALLSFKNYRGAISELWHARKIAQTWVNRLESRSVYVRESILAEDSRRTVLEAARNVPLSLLDWRRELYLSELRMGEIYMLCQNMYEARRCLERACRHAVEAVACSASATVKHDLATILERLGDVWLPKEGRVKRWSEWPSYERALRFFEQSRDIRVALGDNLPMTIADKNHHWQYNRAVNLEKVGDSYQKLNRRDDKLATYKEIRSIIDTLLIECPGSEKYNLLASRIDKKLNQRNSRNSLPERPRGTPLLTNFAIKS